jgi:hypothetical protein
VSPVPAIRPLVTLRERSLRMTSHNQKRQEGMKARACTKSVSSDGKIGFLPGQRTNSRPGGRAVVEQNARKLGSPRSSGLSAAGAVASSGAIQGWRMNRRWLQSSRNANLCCVELGDADSCFGRPRSILAGKRWIRATEKGMVLSPAERNWPPRLRAQLLICDHHVGRGWLLQVAQQVVRVSVGRSALG